MFHAEFRKAIYLPIFFSFIKMTDETPGYQKKTTSQELPSPSKYFFQSLKSILKDS